MTDDLKKLFQAYLMTSYLYYTLDVSVILDDLYDGIAKALLARYDEFDHQHKHLVSKADLEAGTLYHLRGNDYPQMIQMAADLWMHSGAEDRERRELELRQLLDSLPPAD